MSISITPAAAERIRQQIADRGHGLGLRVGITTTGCSGNAYKLDYADIVGDTDVLFEENDARVVVSREDLKMLDGLRVDFVRDGLNQIFRFDNPNASGLCGCGESFHYEDEASTS